MSGWLSPADAGEVFKRFVKKSMQNYNFFKFSSKFRDFFKIFFENFIDFFGENLGKNVENLEICICRGSPGWPPPDASEFMEI